MDSLYKKLSDDLLLYSAIFFMDSIPVPSHPIKWLNHMVRSNKNPWAIELLILYKIQDGKIEQAKEIYKKNKKILYKHLKFYNRKETLLKLLEDYS